MVRPQQESCVPFWLPYQRKDVFGLERMQQRFTRILNLSYEWRLDELGLLTLNLDDEGEQHHEGTLTQGR